MASPVSHAFTLARSTKATWRLPRLEDAPRESALDVIHRATLKHVRKKKEEARKSSAKKALKTAGRT
jgi:hypothetical protein